MSNITANTKDQSWYEELADPTLGMVGGVSNLVFFGAIIGGMLLICGIGGLIYHCKRKKELEEQVKKHENVKNRAANKGKVGPSEDIYDEMEGELQRHEEQKKKLSKYLNFLLAKDAPGLMAVNNKRKANQRARASQGWF